MKQKLLNKLWLRVGMIVAIMTTALSGTAWAETYTIGDTPLSSVSAGDKVVWGTNNTTLATSCSSNWIYCGSSDWIVFTVEAATDGFYLKTPDGMYVYSSATKKVEFSSTKKTVLTIANKDSNHKNIVYNSTAGYYTFNSTGIRPYTSNAYTDAHLYLATPSGTPTPSISAENVDVAYNATSGAIEYTINNSVEGGEVSAAVASGDWLTLGNETTSPISFTCSANNTAAERTATVQLTYTYNTNETVTKDVTVTQAGNPNIVDEISDITASNTEYAVKGTIVAMSARGFVVGDGTGYVYYYYGSGFSTTYNIGDDVKLSGTTSSYGNVIQFPAATTVTAATGSNYDDTPAVQVLDATAIAAYNSGLHLSDYVQLEGKLVKSGNYYNLQVEDLSTDASISYPTTAQTGAMDDLLNKTVIVKGYFAGMSSGHFNVMLESIEEVVSTTPTIIVSKNSLTSFTYEAGSGPSAAQTFTVSGENLTANISLSLGGSDFEMSTTEGSDYTNSLTLTQTSGEVTSTTVYVRLKADKTTSNYSGTITLTSEGATSQTVSLSGSVTAPAAAHVTWDLTTNSYSSASTSTVTWTSSQATMTLAKGESGTNANNYLGGSGSYTQTRFYQNQVLTIAPASGYQIVSAEITAVTGYVTGFTGNAWTSATTSTSGTTVTVTPSNGTQAMSVTISGACRATAVKVYYATNSTPSIAVNTVLNVTSDETEGTIDVTYNNIADNSSATVILCNNEGNATTYDWLDAEINNSKNIYYVISANNGAARTGYMKVKVGDVYSDLITVTQGKHIVYNSYNLATSITSGKHYLITSGKDNGEVKVMAEQKENNRNVVDASIISGKLKVDEEAGAHEVVISGPDAKGYYTIYDDTDNAEGYLYAAASGNNQLKTQSGIDENSLWTISFGEGNVASIVATESSNRNVMQFNSTLISCYASASQSPVYLFEKDGEDTPTESKTLNAYGYATYCSQNALDFTNAEGVTAWAITATNSTTGVITFSQITGSVPAGTGMLLKGTANSSATLTSATGATALTGNLLIGTTADFTVENNGDYYGLSGQSFVKVNAGTVPAGKALLSKSAVEEGTNVKAFTFVFEEDDATAIEMVNGQSSMVNGPIYNLAGQRINKMQKGINIVNGKKIAVK